MRKKRDFIEVLIYIETICLQILRFAQDDTNDSYLRAYG